MISSAILFVIVLYMLHGVCRPHIPALARISILVAAGAVLCWWLMTRTPEQQDTIVQWVQADVIYVILGVIAVAALMVVWAIHLRRGEDRQDATAAEQQRTPVFHPQTS